MSNLTQLYLLHVYNNIFAKEDIYVHYIALTSVCRSNLILFWKLYPWIIDWHIWVFAVYAVSVTVICLKTQYLLWLWWTLKCKLYENKDFSLLHCCGHKAEDNTWHKRKFDKYLWKELIELIWKENHPCVTSRKQVLHSHFRKLFDEWLLAQ